MYCTVVFGRVVEGMMVVKRMEVCGTRGGKPSRKVTIADCGQVSVPNNQAWDSLTYISPPF